MVIYADYEFYVKIYKGELADSEFEKIIIKASAHVRRITFGRADLHAEDEAVKLAACDVIAIYENTKKGHNGRNVASENNDGYSVSYVNEQASGESTEALLNRKIYSAAEIYLMPTGLLNWSIDDDG